MLNDCRLLGAARNHSDRQPRWKGRPHLGLEQTQLGSSDSGMSPFALVEARAELLVRLLFVPRRAATPALPAAAVEEGALAVAAAPGGTCATKR